MTEPNTTGVITPDTATTPAITPPVAAAAAAPIAPATTVQSEPEWLGGRVAQAKRSAEADLLKTLGVATADEAKAAIATAKAKADADKTAEQRATETAARLTKAEETLLAQHKAMTGFAASQMGALTPEQQAAVKAVAGEDAGMQLSAITALRPTWSAAQVAALAAAGAAATTAPAAGAPNGAAPAPQNARAVYEQMRVTNPFAAAAFGAAHPEVYIPKQ